MPARWHGRVSVSLGLPLLIAVDPAVAAGTLGNALPGGGAAVGMAAGAWALVLATATGGDWLDLVWCGLLAALLTVAWFRWQAGRSTPARQGAAAAVEVAARPGAGAQAVQWVLPRSAPTLPSGMTCDDVVASAMRDFVRLQQAWDARDVATLRHLTLPEMLDDLLAVLAAHEPASRPHTEVLTLRADLLACDVIGADYLASVEFTGLMRESPDTGATPFRELWMMTRSAGEASDWRLARQQSLS